MVTPLRQEVLQAFKNVHKASREVFKGDQKALRAARIKINQEFQKNKTVTNPNSVHDMIVFANAVAKELRTNVVQAKETTPGVYKLRISPETQKLDNMPFDPDVEIPKNFGKSKCTPPPKTSTN